METFKKIIYLLLLASILPYLAFWAYFNFELNVLFYIMPICIFGVLGLLFVLRQELAALKKLTKFVKDLKKDGKYSVQLSKLEIGGFSELVDTLNTVADRFEAKQRELRQVIDLVPGFIYSKDMNGNILLVNEALSKFLKISSLNMLGKNEDEFEVLGCLGNKELEKEILESKGTGSISAHECELSGKISTQNNDEVSTYLVFRAPLLDKNSKKLGILVFAYDITMLKNIQQNLETLNFSLEERVKEEVAKNSSKDKELIEAKEKFVRNAVHELNSALTVITLNAEYLMEEYGKSRSTSAILGAAKNLSNSYDDLSYATVKNSPFFQEEKEIDLNALLKERIRFFEDIAGLNDIVIQSDILSDKTVLMNIVKLTRVVDNNLSNAIKYSYPKNTIFVRYFCDDGILTLEFESIGRKIEDKNKIFDLYSRENGVKRGHGVGLSMVKEICNECKIGIEVECEENKNTFRYRFSNAC